MNSDSCLGKTVILYVILTTCCNHRDSQNSSSMESIAFSLSTMWTMYSAGWGEVMAWGWPLWDPATGSTVAQELHNGDNKPWKRGWTGVWTPICQEEHCALGGTFPPAGAGKMFRISPPPHTHTLYHIYSLSMNFKTGKRLAGLSLPQNMENWKLCSWKSSHMMLKIQNNLGS